MNPPSDPPSDRDTDPEESPPSRTVTRPMARASGPHNDEHINLTDLRDRIDHVEQQLGEAPDASTGRKGIGMAKVLAGLAADMAELKAEAKRRAAARARWIAIIGVPSVAVGIGVTASLIAIMSKLFGWGSP